MLAEDLPQLVGQLVDMVIALQRKAAVVMG
jgi:hypothetical protein